MRSLLAFIIWAFAYHTLVTRESGSNTWIFSFYQEVHCPIIYLCVSHLDSWVSWYNCSSLRRFPMWFKSMNSYLIWDRTILELPTSWVCELTKGMYFESSILHRKRFGEFYVSRDKNMYHDVQPHLPRERPTTRCARTRWPLRKGKRRKMQLWYQTDYCSVQ